MAHPPRIDSEDRWLAGLYSKLIPAAVLGSVGTLLTDWAYTASATLQWSNFSAWLLLAALVGGVPAALVLALDRRTNGGGWIGLILLSVAIVIQVVNFMIHMRDGWTTVVPTGMTLSILGTAAMLVAAWMTRRSHWRPQ